MHKIRMIKHVSEDIGAAQVGRQGERPRHQPIQRRMIAHCRFHPPHHIENQGQAARCFIRQAVGDGERVFQGMAHNGWRGFLRPIQVTSQNLGLDLQIEQHRLTVGRIDAVHFEQRFK